MQYVYDAAGNALKRTLLGTDGECLESSTRYDLKDRATHRTNPAGGVTRYLYDRNDRLRKEISPYGYEPETMTGQAQPTPMTAGATASAPPMH